MVCTFGHIKLVTIQVQPSSTTLRRPGLLLRDCPRSTLSPNITAARGPSRERCSTQRLFIPCRIISNTSSSKACSTVLDGTSKVSFRLGVRPPLEVASGEDSNWAEGSTGDIAVFTAHCMICPASAVVVPMSTSRFSSFCKIVLSFSAQIDPPLPSTACSLPLVCSDLKIDHALPAIPSVANATAFRCERWYNVSSTLNSA